MTTADLRPLEEQTVVIVGASSGIGLTTARMAAERGARVVVAARSEDALAELVEEIEGEGGDATYVVADVRDREDVREIAETAATTYGDFDTWVNCAAAFIYGTIEETPVEDMREQFETNVWGTVYGTLEATEHFRERGGAIVNVGSIASERALPLQGSYSASKHAVKGFTDALRDELERDGAPISVTLIEPASIDTPYPEHARNYMDKEADLPQPVYAPEEVARSILHAAERPEREIVVGGGGRALVGADRLSTGLASRLTQTLFYDGQRSDRIATEGGPDVLDEPVGDLEARGDQQHVRGRSVYTRARLNRSALAATLLGGLGAGLAYLRLRGRRGERPTGEVLADVATTTAESVPDEVVERTTERAPDVVADLAVEALPDEVVGDVLEPEREPPGQLFADVERPDWPWLRGAGQRGRERSTTTRTGSTTGRVARAVVGTLGLR